MISRKLLMTFIIMVGSVQLVLAGPFPIVHSYRSGAAGIYSNAYIIELQNGVIVVDATLAVSSGKEIRNLIDEIGKPVYAILITHGHPDHYNGLTEIMNGLSAPIYSTQGVLDVITKYDKEKENQWKPTFGAEWPAKRTFPSKIIKDSESLKFENTSFTVHDLGPGESHSDSYWIMKNGSAQYAFIGDIVLHKVHAYLSDGHASEWLRHLKDLKVSLKDIALFYPGHGLPGGLEIFSWQEKYLETYLTNLKPLWDDRQITQTEKTILAEKMKKFLPNDRLDFLIGLGAEPVASNVFQ